MTEFHQTTKAFLNKISLTEILDKQGELELFEKFSAATADEKKKIKHQLIACNMKLVLKVVNWYSTKMSTLDVDDLFQEGVIGLSRAIDKFDVTKGYKFSTYATWWIRQAITKAFDYKSRAIRIPSYLVPILKKMTGRVRDGHTVHLDEFAEEFGIQRATAQGLSYQVDKVVSLNLSEDSDSPEHIDFISYDADYDGSIDSTDLVDTILDTAYKINAEAAHMLWLNAYVGFSIRRIAKLFGTSSRQVKTSIANIIGELSSVCR